jgi:outer membrane protein assembly factor BamB
MKKLIIALFIISILIVNILTYKYLSKSDNIAETTAVSSSASEISSDTNTETAASTENTYEIETIVKEIPEVDNFAPSPVSLTLPSNFLLDITNFGYLPDTAVINFKEGGEYTKLPGIITFRGNNFRSQTSYGTADIIESKMEIVWDVDIGNIDAWTGVGWTGQPLIVQWPDDLRQIMNIKESKKSKKDLKEVIYATLDGNIYFLDLDDGQKTREPINVGYPHKGTLSIDPRGYPLLYAGQGINLIHGERVELGWRIFSLIDQKLLYFLNGIDSDSKRTWFAFDSSAIVDGENDTVYEPGENGILYKMKLNTQFDLNSGSISIDPQVSKYRYDPSLNFRPGIENSMVAYKNCGFFSDNSGFIQCVDLNTLEPVWANNLKEDTDASIVAEVENGDLSLYVGSEVDFQGTSGIAYVRKVNGSTGEFVWENEYVCGSDADVNGGVLATPVLGSGDLKDYVFFNIAKIDNSNQSLLVALDKRTGEEIWRYKQNNYSWSSPIFVRSSNDTYHIIQCDSIGQVILFDARTGIVEDVLDTGTNIEGSPVLYDDMLVIGTRGQKIFGIRIY